MDSVQQYLQEIGRHPLLTPTEEIEYSRQIQAMVVLKTEHPDATTYTRQQRNIIRRGKRAKDQIITRNLRLVVMIAKKYQKRCTSMELLDLIQFGNIGLNRASELFDPSRGYKFSTYAYWWIRQSISRGLQDSDRMIRLPVHRYDKVMRANAYMNKQLATTGRMPTLAECAAALELDPEDLQTSLQMAQDVFSLDAPAGNNADKSDLIDLVADEASLHQDDDFLIERDLLADVIETLDHDEREMICHYHGIYGYKKLTLGAIGQQHGISRQALSLRLQRAMNKVRQRIRQRCQNQ
jgi:RNA polymerase sigma factor (sigma-70 family)